jgi:hypothetical protein
MSVDERGQSSSGLEAMQPALCHTRVAFLQSRVVSPREPATDGELLPRAAGRDRDAFSALYVRYETIVAGYHP